MKLLFIPGSGGGKVAWIYQTEYFPDSEAIALPGHPEGEPCSSVDEYVVWLRDYVNRQGYQDVVLVGHSLGGAIAQLYGLNHGNELKALVLIGAGARLRVHPDRLAEVRQMVGNESAWRKNLEDTYSSAESKVRQAEINSRTQIGPAVLLNDFLCCDKFDIMDRVHNITLPTLVICGTEDVMTPVKYARYLVDKIGGATEVIIDGATHAVAKERPEEVNQAIERFLGGLN